ncbi:MAG: hypothetical protein HY776_02180 [Actinobacteria bacterium]|nr:hypothetical protein [Actinomycetota bacterium]
MLSLKFLKDEKGFATYIAIGIIFVLMALSIGISAIVSNEVTLVGHGSSRAKAYYLAEAGINHAIWKLNQTTPSGEVSGDFGDEGTYSTTYSGQVLTSTGTFNGVTRKIIVNTIETTAPSAFDVGVFFGSVTSSYNNVPTSRYSNVVIWNGLASTDQNKVVLENYYNVGATKGWLNIYGYVLNKPEVLIPPNPSDPRPHTTLRDPERHAVAYARRVLNPVNYLGSFSEGRRGSTPSGYSPPYFNTTSYDSKIASVPSGVSQIWSTNVILSPGQRYVRGNLTINNGARITTNPSVTKTNPAEVVVRGNVYIDGRIANGITIGNASGDSYINILARGSIYFNPWGTNPYPVYLKKETQYYSQSNIYVYDNTRMEQASIFARGSVVVQSRYNLTANPDIDLDGILFSGNLIQFVVNASGGTIEFDGGAVAGYKNAVGTIFNRPIIFTTPNRSGRLIQVTASPAAKPSQMPSVFQIPVNVQPDYKTWRED